MKRKGSVLYFLLALICGGLLEYANPKVLESVDLRVYDWMITNRALPERAKNIVIIDINEQTLKQLKKDERYAERARWPFPVSFHEEIARRAFEKGALVVGFDLLNFTDPSLPLYKSEDAKFAEMCKEWDQQVVLASKFEQSNLGGIQREEWSLPLKDFRKNATYGYVNVIANKDNVLRTFEPERKRMIVFKEKSFAVKLVEAYDLKRKNRTATQESSDSSGNSKSVEKAPPSAENSQSDTLWYTVNDHKIPLTSSGKALISFTKTPHREGPGYNVISYWKLLCDKDYDENILKNAIVIVGATFKELHDFSATPLTTSGLGATMGVNIQADMVSSLLESSNLRKAPEFWKNLMSFLMALAGFAIGLWSTAIVGPFLIIALSGLALMATNYICSAFGIIIPAAMPLALIILIFVVVMAARLAGEERQQRLIRNMFSAYVSKNVLSYLENNPEAFALKGERRDVTVFFSDIAGFTTFSESLEPDVLASLINSYLTPMSEIIMKQGGYIDKYIGDAIMAVFGVPMPLENSAFKCCEAALEQSKALNDLNSIFKKKYGTGISVRMGINSGPVSAGNMGSERRFQYTVMGDTVNLGSRLEAANKPYGTSIMVGHNTYEIVKDKFFFRFLDLLVVKGKEEPVSVYELLGTKEEVSEQLKKAIECFEKAWKLYSERHWDEAIAAFEEAIKLRGKDSPSSL
jgi:adenylate cyclase